MGVSVADIPGRMARVKMCTLHVVIDTDKNLFLLPHLKGEFILGHRFSACLATQCFLVTVFKLLSILRVVVNLTESQFCYFF